LYIAFDDLPNLRPWSQKPLNADSVFTARNWTNLEIMGHLKRSVTRGQAQAELSVLFHDTLSTDWKPAKTSDLPAFTLIPGSQGIPHLREDFTEPLRTLMVLVALGLLIACANIATLLLARASTRRREISVRLAVGASRPRLIRQLLTETVLLALLGGGFGLLFAGWATSMLVSMFSGEMSRIALDVKPDSRVLLFTLGVAVVSGMLFGLLPALRASSLDLASVMKEATTSLVAGGEKHRLGNSLVVAQVAASLVLMVGAGLFVRTLENYDRQNYGFNQEHLLTFGVGATRQGYQGDRLIEVYRELQDRVGALPGVTAATAMNNAPFSGWAGNSSISFEGRPTKADTPVRWLRVGPDFFRTMQIPIVLGRGIEARDTAASPRVAVVDQTFVERYFPKQNPIGQRFSLSSSFDPKDVMEIVGVSEPAELTDPHHQPMPKAYASYPQFPASLASMYFELRTTGDPATVISELRDLVRAIDPDLPLMNVRTEAAQLDEALVGERLFARLSTFFGLLALTLASIGLYGTISYAVSRQTQEIGIRMALGAKPGDISRMVVNQGIKLVGTGLGIGMALALGTTRLARDLIFGVQPDDPWTLLGAAALLAAVATVACYIPARRAARVAPLAALRHE
jgi:macrolide transport system ATP-binding/permease protein